MTISCCWCSREAYVIIEGITKQDYAPFCSFCKSRGGLEKDFPNNRVAFVGTLLWDEFVAAKVALKLRRANGLDLFLT